MTQAIETARIKDITKEQVLHFNKELRRVIQEYDIQLENIFNVDETDFHTPHSVLTVGCSIGTMQTSNVIVDITISEAYEAQPG